jgi:hypothetical protein
MANASKNLKGCSISIQILASCTASILQSHAFWRVPPWHWLCSNARIIDERQLRRFFGGKDAMMKQLVLVGTLVGALGAGTGWAQTGAKAPAKKPANSPAKADQGAGHTAPKTQPETAPAPSIPTGEMQLGSVRLTKAVKADGKSLAPGTYEVRLTAQNATPDAKGETPASERWVEFMQGGKVAGREVVTIIAQSEIAQVQKDAPPKVNGSKVETLKGGDYVRVWINKGGNHYLLHLPTAA